MQVNSIWCSSVYQNKNTYSCQPSYRGLLKNSGELQTAIKNGSDYSIHKLRTLMEIMPKINDEKVYILRNTQTHYGYYNLELQCLDYKNNVRSADIIVAQKNKLDKKDPLYKKVLLMVNSILEEHYAEKQLNSINREQEIKIMDTLFPNKLN